MSSYQNESECLKNAVLSAWAKNRTLTRERKEKSAFDIVTDLDISMERDILGVIREKFPQDRILSEETNPEVLPSGRTWTVDPIDGTFNMAADLPLFGVQASLYDEGKSVVALLYLPFFDELYSAEVGEGAWCNGKRITVFSLPPEKSMISFGDLAHRRKNDLLRQKIMMDRAIDSVAKFRMFGTAAFDFCWLACGKIQGTVLFTKNRWDLAPGILLAREAGALIAGEKGAYTDTSACVIGAADEKILSVLTSSLPDEKEIR